MERLNRRTEEFWAIDDYNNIVQVTGYECNKDSNIWWIPKIGYTCGRKLLFKSEKAACKSSIKDLEKQIRVLTTRLNRNKQQLKKLQTTFL